MLPLFFILLFILLLFPETAAAGSKSGLILWATVLVPSLLPFSILTSLIRRYMAEKPYHTHTKQFMCQGRTQRIAGFRTSPHTYLLLAAGILSGYPIGAKIAGELYLDGSLTYKKALFFAGFTNNPSPMFVLFFVGGNTLHLASGTYLFYGLMLLSSFLGSLCFTLAAPRISHRTDRQPRPRTEAGGELPFSKVIDAEISACALLMIKIGGYIMLFSILASLMRDLPLIPYYAKLFLGNLLEITTGNAMTAEAALPHNIKTILSLAFTSFGGLSAAAQTNSVLQNTGLSLFHYLIMKFLGGLFALLLGCLFFL